MENTKNPSLLILEQGDITESNAQAIFSATNPDLILKAVVVCALRKKAGRKFKKNVTESEIVPWEIQSSPRQEI